MDESVREARRRAGAAGGRRTAELRRANAGTARTPAAGPPAAPGPDGLVYGTAAQLRQLAEALQPGGDDHARSNGLQASASRVAAFKARHPRADLSNLTHRPLCEAAVADPPVAAGVRVRNAVDGPAEMWIDDLITWPNAWGEGISARDVRAALDEIDGGDVVVHMNSPGGDVFEGVSIYQMFRDYPGNVYVAVDALAASIASVIAMGGDTVGVGDLAMMMIHEASGFAYGNAADMLVMAGLLDQVSTVIASAYAGKVPNTTVAHWRDLMLAETWFTATEALDAGLADERLAGSTTTTGDDTSTDGPVDRVMFLTGMAAALKAPAAPTPADHRLAILNGLKEAHRNG